MDELGSATRFGPWGLQRLRCSSAGTEPTMQKPTRLLGFASHLGALGYSGKPVHSEDDAYLGPLPQGIAATHTGKRWWTDPGKGASTPPPRQPVQCF